jgi:hypothetical protein
VLKLCQDGDVFEGSPLRVMSTCGQKRSRALGQETQDLWLAAQSCRRSVNLIRRVFTRVTDDAPSILARNGSLVDDAAERQMGDNTPRHADDTITARRALLAPILYISYVQNRVWISRIQIVRYFLYNSQDRKVTVTLGDEKPRKRDPASIQMAEAARNRDSQRHIAGGIP